MVIDHDEFDNHTIKKIALGVSPDQQFENPSLTLKPPRDRLKHTPQFSLEEFEHWSDRDIIVAQGYIGDKLMYRVRFKNTSPVFDQFLSTEEAESKGLLETHPLSSFSS